MSGRLALVAALALAACADADPRIPHERQIVAGAHPDSAIAAMRRYGCASCHVIPGLRGADALVGPPLAGFAGRRFIAGREPNEPETLVRWIQNPQAIKPQTAMPNTGVTEQAARDIASYLYTLR